MFCPLIYMKSISLNTATWPNNIVPYQHSQEHTKQQQNFIEQALETIESVSCVKFVRRTFETNYIQIKVRLLILITLV